MAERKSTEVDVSVAVSTADPLIFRVYILACMYMCTHCTVCV